MKRYPFAYAFVASLLIAACAGSLTRSNVALPALASVWQRIRVDIADQLQVAPNVVTEAQLAMADAALATDDPLRAAAVDWDGLLAVAAVSIDRQVASGAMPAVVAGSFRERLAQFQLTIDTYNRRGAR
jgi:hypothetical protein